MEAGRERYLRKPSLSTGMNSGVHPGEKKGSENELSDVNMPFECGHEVLVVQTPGPKIQICRLSGLLMPQTWSEGAQGRRARSCTKSACRPKDPQGSCRWSTNDMAEV